MLILEMARNGMAVAARHAGTEMATFRMAVPVHARKRTNAAAGRRPTASAAVLSVFIFSKLCASQSKRYRRDYSW